MATEPKRENAFKKKGTEFPVSYVYKSWPREEIDAKARAKKSKQDKNGHKSS